jgi:hypothetical protein
MAPTSCTVHNTCKRHNEVTKILDLSCGYLSHLSNGKGNISLICRSIFDRSKLMASIDEQCKIVKTLHSNSTAVDLGG